MRICFFSDLHLFSRRSTAGYHLPRILDAASEADLVVLGGDLFDFRWSVYRDREHTIQLAMHWLNNLMESVGEARICYLTGNHDNEPEFVTQLTELESEREQFWLACDCLVVGDTALLHGDCIDVSGDADRLVEYRQRWGEKRRRGEIASRIYDMAVRARLHRVAAAAAHNQTFVASKILRYLECCGITPDRGLRRVVFGHTHRCTPGFDFGGVHFINGGATIHGVPFHPVVLSADPRATPRFLSEGTWTDFGWSHTGPPPAA